MTARAQPLRIDIDAYYANRPSPPELFRWPVHSDFFLTEKPIWFDTWDEASTFAMANNLYVGVPVRRRK